MRAMQLASNSVGASFFWPIRRRASIAVRSQGSAISVTQRQSVLAWIGSADETATGTVDPYRLTTAMRPIRCLQFVPSLRQRIADVARDAVLDLHLSSQREQPWQVDRLLNVEAVFQHVGEEQRVPH